MATRWQLTIGVKVREMDLKSGGVGKRAPRPSKIPNFVLFTSECLQAVEGVQHSPRCLLGTYRLAAEETVGNIFFRKLQGGQTPHTTSWRLPGMGELPRHIGTSSRLPFNEHRSTHPATSIDRFFYIHCKPAFAPPCTLCLPIHSVHLYLVSNPPCL